MPQPTYGDVHVDAILSNISTAYMSGADNNRYVADKVFPVIPVDKKTNKYYVYPKGDWFRDEAALRAPGTESVGSGYRLSTDSYSCDVFAFHKDIDDQTRSNADSQIDLDRDATLFITQRMLLRREIQWVTDFFTTGVWGTDWTGVAAAPTGNQFLQWNDANSDPVSNIEAMKTQMLSTTGYVPNTLTLGYQVFAQLKQHPAIYNRIKYTTAENITLDLLARLFELDRVFVASAVKNTANEGATNAFSFVHGKAALLTYSAPNPGLMTPSAGYSFTWTGVSDGLGLNVGISSFPIPALRVQRVESQMAWDNKVVATDLGIFLASAIA